jgi:hypothetical protein
MRKLDLRRHISWLRFILKPTIAVFLALILGRCSSPPLSISDAAQIIRKTPEFSDSRKLVSVTSTVQGGDSSSFCCYQATFTFISSVDTQDSKAGEIVPADAEFRYWNGKWHLQLFSYEGQQIVIRSDAPGNPNTAPSAQKTGPQ